MIAPETVAELVALAEQCQLPSEFVAALQHMAGLLGVLCKHLIINRNFFY